MANKRIQKNGRRRIDDFPSYHWGHRSVPTNRDCRSGRRSIPTNRSSPWRNETASCSFDMETNDTSFSDSLIDSFDEDAPVFVDSEERGTRSIRRAGSLSKNCMHRGRMHEKLREKWSAGLAEQHVSQSSLQRKKALSASCPLLASGAAHCVTPSNVDGSKLLVDTDVSGILHKSMLNLSNADSMAPVSSSVDPSLDPSTLRVARRQSDYHLPCDTLQSMTPLPEINVQICINDISVDTAEDFQTASDDEDDLNLDMIKRQKRRSSWCPEQERKKDEKEEKQRMLGVNGRSQSLSSLEGQDDSDDSDSDSSGALATTHANQPSKSFVKNAATLLANGTLADSTDCICANSFAIPSDRDRCEMRTNDRPPLTKLGERLTSSLNHRNEDITVKHIGQLGEACSHSADENLFVSPGNKHFRDFGDVSSRGDCAFANEYSRPKSVSPADGCSADDVQFYANRRVARLGSHSEIIFPKEEKTRRRSSVFSKISSYRQNRKALKSPKLNHNDHRFVSVSVSNSTSCDVCGKFLSNKPALQCENCAINVHEASCIDQTVSCAKINRLPTKDEILQKDVNRGEDENAGDAVDSVSKFSFGSAHVLSHSTESLSDGYVTLGDVDDETESLPTDDMAEAWSVTVDKKTLKKMSAKEIKRQDHIWELILTERNHYRTLKKMQKVFALGMMKEVGLGKELVEQIFPRLDDLLEIHLNFLRHFLERQQKHGDQSIERIGDLLLDLFQSQTGSLMRSAYGEFCSRHSDAVNVFKELRKTDRKFQTFIDKCSRLNVCQRQGVDGCILLVTQRLTKYPILIEAIIKTTIDAKDRELLNSALTLIKDIVTSVDRHVDAFFKRQRFVDILNRLDQKSSTFHRGTKFKKFELLVCERKLRHDGYLKWMSARGKPAEVLAVVLSDIMFFLTESNQKYYFFSQDGKSSVVSLSKLLVREKDDMRDSRGFYLICSSDEPEMYELVCKSTEERSQWIALLKDAIVKCSQEDSVESSQVSHNGMSLSGSSSPTKIQQLLRLLQEKDEAITTACKEKTQIISEILEIFGNAGEKTKTEDFSNSFDPTSTMDAVIQLETRLLMALKQINSLAGHKMADFNSLTNDLISTHQKKRAETFSGFEHKNREPVESLKSERRRYASGFDDSNTQHVTNECLTSGDRPPDLKSARRASLVITSNPTDTSRSNNNISNNGDKSSRRMSVNLIPNVVLNKLHRDKETVQTPLINQFSGKTDELSVTTHVSPSSSWLSTLVQDQCESLAQIAVNVQALSEFVSKQSTELHCLRVELNGTSQNVSKLFKENDRLLTDRRLSGFQHDKQLEELRSLQSSIEKQKKELLKFREEQEAELQREREQISQRQADIEKQKTDLKIQKEHLRQEKEFLQRQYDLFEEQRKNSLSSLSPFSPFSPHLGAKFAGWSGSSSGSSSVYPNQDPACSESSKVNESPGSGSAGETSKRDDSSSPLPSSNSRYGQARRKSSASSEIGTIGKIHAPTCVQQILPMKLSTGTIFSRNSRHPNVPPTPEKPNSCMSKNFSESSIVEGGVAQKSSSFPWTHNLGISRSQPQINYSISAIPTHVKTSIIPSKLSEKSKSTPASAHNSPTRFSVPSADVPKTLTSAEKSAQKTETKTEPEIIFF